MQVLYESFNRAKHDLIQRVKYFKANGYGQFIDIIDKSVKLNGPIMSFDTIQLLSVAPIANELLAFYCSYISYVELKRQYNFLVEELSASFTLYKLKQAS